MKVPVVLSLTLAVVCFFSCKSPSAGDAAPGSGDPSGKSTPAASGTRNPEFRKTVKEEAVVTYQEKTDNPLNDWYFTVKLYETPKTLRYVVTMQFEEIKGRDTLELPDFGTPPQPVIQKGKDRYSCIIGFLDNEKKFREYKRVYVKDGNNLKLTTLRHYSLTGQPE